MSSAHIVANQAGKPAGQSSVSRRDLDLAVPVFLSNASDDGVRSHRWRMVDRPSGSTAVITNKASAVSQFTPDVAGSYLVELQVDDADEGQVDRRVFAVLTDFGGATTRPLRIPAAGEDAEANWLYDFGVTLTPNTRGWQPDFVELLLYTGLLAPAAAAALDAVLTVGNTTGGLDILLSAGDALRGAPGQPATIVGGSGVSGNDAVMSGADATGPVGDGGDVSLAGGAGAGGGADGVVLMRAPDVVLTTASANLRGADGGSPTGFTLRAGDGVGGNTPGAELVIRGGDSVGSGAGSSVAISPGDVVTGARGRVAVSHTGPDVDALLSERTSGTDGAEVLVFVGTRNPSAGVAPVVADCGDVYRRDSGTLGEVYVKSEGNANDRGWHKLGNVTLFSRDHVTQVVSATVVETTIASHTVPGYALGVNGTLQVRAQGTLTAEAANPCSFTFRLTFGGVPVYEANTGNLDGTMAWALDVTLVNANSLGAQGGGGQFSLSASPSTAAVGVGNLDFGFGALGGAISLATSAVDTTVDQTFDLSVEHSSATATAQTVRTSTQGYLSLH
jgi:hypothetical protein